MLPIMVVFFHGDDGASYRAVESSRRESFGGQGIILLTLRIYAANRAHHLSVFSCSVFWDWLRILRSIGVQYAIYSTSIRKKKDDIIGCM